MDKNKNTHNNEKDIKSFLFLNDSWKNDTKTKVDKNGRILLPMEVRKKLNVKTDDVFVVRIIDEEIHLVNIKKVIKEAQDFFSNYIPQGASPVEELMKARKAEVEKDNKEWQ
ncbi:MAG: AbrB/MazE/SpoVT family DNA-binding domain-containing protein [Sphingobacteriia bacterium]|nr:AbrB/MazE/SpoVT family DNA-binding domain-containing protein [Sphingobacteriia bacterium]